MELRYFIEYLTILVQTAVFSARIDDFVYTSCAKLNKDQCLTMNMNDFLQDYDAVTRSKWPEGPYSLITPNEGCPESEAYGWRRGYLSFTWQDPHTLITRTGCDDTTRNNEEIHDTDVNTDDDNGFGCINNFTTDNWPYSGSNILGPFSSYALRLNFCCREKGNATVAKRWPKGAYGVFGDASGCPKGFVVSERIMKLSKILSWKSHGCLPEFNVNDTGDYVMLELKLCMHLKEDEEMTEGDIGILDMTYPFIFAKVDGEECPELYHTNRVSESLFLSVEENGRLRQTELFPICYYRHFSYITDSDTYIYVRDEFPTITAFTVSNPRLFYENKTLQIVKNPSQNGIPQHWPWTDGYERPYIPLLVLDLGINLMVDGLEILFHPLEEMSMLEYYGTLSVTRNGIPCQRWDHIYPHTHSYHREQELFPDKSVSEANNYCRSLDYDECIWCYTQDPFVRWDCCAYEVFKAEQQPFLKCFISEERWLVQEFGAITCPYRLYYDNRGLYFKFLRDIEGRYITLAGFEDTDFSKVVKVLTKPELLYNSAACNIDLGMKDGSIREQHISVSSWQPSYPQWFIRPFARGWCAEASDQIPYVMIDLVVETILEGISIWNWEETVESVEKGKHKKNVIPKGSSKILVYYFSNMSLGYEANENKTFKLAMYLPVVQPQTFFHQAILARYVKVHIIQPITATSNCIRFELLGCKRNGLPELINDKLVEGGKEQYVRKSNINFLQKQPSVITNIGHPTHYMAGISNTWIIDIRKQGYLKLLFTHISFNTYENPTTNYFINKCDDKLQLKYAFTAKKGLLMDRTFNGLTSLIESYVTYMALSFTSCLPTARIFSQGAGFKAILSTQGDNSKSTEGNDLKLYTVIEHNNGKCNISSCFSFGNELSREIINTCNLPIIRLSSMSRMDIPHALLPQRWNIKYRKFSIHLKIIYFNLRCDSGSLFSITDRYSGRSTYCNINMVPTDIYTDSDTVDIEWLKDKTMINTNQFRYSAGEGFEATYFTNSATMTHLIDSKGTNFPVVHQLYYLQLYGYRAENWKNATLLAYKGCSKTFGKCYSIFYGLETTWKVAGEECWIRQQRLVSIHFALEQQLLKYMLRNFRYVDMGIYNVETAFPEHIPLDPYTYAHIGLTRIKRDTGAQIHVWEDESPVTYSAWKVGEPSSGKDCTRMSFHLAYTNDTWEAEDCENGHANYFICEEPITDKLLNLSDSFYTHLYSGTLNRTVTGKACQRWDSLYPHDHGYRTRKYVFPHDASVSDAQNFCRDPDVGGYIWCFTMDPNERWEKCLQSSKVLDNIFPRLYAGRLSKTTSNRTCQRWDSQEPHPHNAGKSPTSFPDASVEDARNYCRDPSEEGTLWCFTTDPDKEWEPCSYIDTASDRCYATHSTHKGQWNKTRSGRDCQRWNSQIPHSHVDFSDTQFPDGSVFKAVNYCRDPYGEGFLWCFTTDPAVKSEQCDFDYKYTMRNNAIKTELPDDMFLCKNGDAVPIQYVCNGKPNCQDFSDETNCSIKVHALVSNRTAKFVNPRVELSLFQCDNKEWISMLAHCDNVIDCLDASDETNCTSDRGTACSSEQFACKDYMRIHISQMCDFVEDCVDASDEDCDYPVCSAREFRCNNGQCIPEENRCDAFEQCIDGTDENSCDICKDEAFHCDLVQCIPKRLVCDKYPDCKDGSDELACGELRHLSCEEWWEAGSRQSGIYKLLDTEAECDFESVQRNGKIYTIFHNFEVTWAGFGEVIHTTSGELSQSNLSDFTMINIMKDPQYSCVQNITQTCIPAHQAVWDSGNGSDVIQCKCITLTVVPYRYFEFRVHDEPKIYASYCDGTGILSEQEQDQLLMFNYAEFGDVRYLELREGFPVWTELQLGPAGCVHERKFSVNKVGCGEENNVFPLPIRCVYNTDAAGFVVGCRSGKHLQDCEDFQCPAQTVKCPKSFCIPLRFVCDGHIQCPGGEDEKDCGCKDEDREVILLYENNGRLNAKHQMRTLANQFYTQNTVIRLLEYQTRTNSEILDSEQRLLDISDEIIKPHETVTRQFVCKYSLLASNFINSIKFSTTGHKGIIFIQNRAESAYIAKLMFAGIKTRPEFHIYRVLRGIDETPGEDVFDFVTDVVIKRWEILATIDVKFFPQICQVASNIHCPGEYACAASKTCVLLEQVCDGQTQCFHGDDERLCRYFCPKRCSCSEYTSNCSNSNINGTTLLKIHQNSRLIDLTGNGALRDLLQNTELSFPYLVSLFLSKCEIQSMRSKIFQLLGNLRVLDLSFNKLSILPMNGFTGLKKLTTLNLFENTNIYRIESSAFQGLLSIRNTELIAANISLISSNAFAGLRLDTLNFTNNIVYEIEGDAFGSLDVTIIDFTGITISYFNNDLFSGVTGLTNLRSPSYKYCCVRPNYLPEQNCLPSKDEFSSCEDLLRLPALQTMLWLIGLCALFGNVFSVIYRIIYNRERLKLNYEIFVTNLAVADFLMGVYLMIIAIADAVYRKRYIFMDDHWRNSMWCTFAGFLSTMSSEAGVLFLCVITLDRFLAIKYPLGQIRLSSKKASIVSLVIWSVSVIIGLVPILFVTYFQGKFYSKSGVCIALPLTRDRPPGWLYSIVIFVGLNSVTFCLIAIGQASIYMEVRRAASGIRSAHRAKRHRVELAVAKNLLLVVSTDFMCWFPIGCLGLIAMSGSAISGDVYAWTTVFILPVNSALNPVLYTLSAILSKRKSKSKMEQTKLMPLNGRRKAKRGHMTGLFQYFVRRDTAMQTLISLESFGFTEQKLTTTTVVRISMQLAHCLHLLHKNLLTIDYLEDGVLYMITSNDKVVGDILLRKEPFACKETHLHQEDICKLGNLLRQLVMRVPKKQTTI